MNVHLAKKSPLKVLGNEQQQQPAEALQHLGSVCRANAVPPDHPCQDEAGQMEWLLLLLREPPAGTESKRCGKANGNPSSNEMYSDGDRFCLWRYKK